VSVDVKDATGDNVRNAVFWAGRSFFTVASRDIALDLLAILASVRLPRVRYVTGCIAMVAMLGSFAINELTRYVAEMITINI
jgi:hypothetical protein